MVFLTGFPNALLAAVMTKGVTGLSIVRNVENRLWSQTNHGSYLMIIKTHYWKRTLELEAWMQRPQRTLVRIHSPMKEKGVGSLRLGNEMWNYLPKVNRTIKVPPSMMLQPWMGSDFSNDDLVKESSLLNDYNHQVKEIKKATGEALYQVISTPKENAAVVWGHIELWVRKSDLMPLRQAFFDEHGDRVKQLTYDQVKRVGGRLLPTHWIMQPMDKPNRQTELLIKRMEFDQPMDKALFTLRTLRQP
jgi:outer membrane lipoprotein-sorting protein